MREDGILSLHDAAEIGFKVVEMADRLRDVDAAMPGSQASFGFEIDGRHFLVLVRVNRNSAGDVERSGFPEQSNG